MGKLGFLGVFVVVSGLHFWALQSVVKQQQYISKPKAKVHRITLSSVVVKKPEVIPPVHTVEPIILPPEPEVVVEKPRPKPIKKKKPKKKVKKKQKVVKKPIIQEPIPEPVIEPIVEQVIAPVVSVDTASIKDQYTAEIRRAIQKNLYYPKMAKRMRMQGIVEVSFRVLRNGKITDIKVLNGAKKLLKDGAIKTLKSLSLKPIPRELDDRVMDITLPIEFKLT